jgi:hypothetical protein
LEVVDGTGGESSYSVRAGTGPQQIVCIPRIRKLHIFVQIKESNWEEHVHQQRYFIFAGAPSTTPIAIARTSRSSPHHCLIRRDDCRKDVKAAWHEMKMHGPAWLTSADRFLVEIAAVLLTGHRAGEQKTTSLLIGLLSKLGFSPKDRGALNLPKE